MAQSLPWLKLFWRDILAGRTYRDLTNGDIGAWLRLACASMEYDEPGVFVDIKDGPVPPDKIRASIGCKLDSWERLLKSGAIRVELASNSVAVASVDYVVLQTNSRRSQAERQHKHRAKSKSVTAVSQQCHADVTPMSQKCHGESQSQSQMIESESEIPPLPPAGERRAVEAKKPSSKSGRATWEQAWSAFCEGAALDARGAADYEYPTREWFEHKKSKGPLSERGWRALGRQVKTWGADRLRQAVDYSSSNGYQGLFEARTNGKPVYESTAPRLPDISEVD